MQHNKKLKPKKGADRQAIMCNVSTATMHRGFAASDSASKAQQKQRREEWQKTISLRAWALATCWRSAATRPTWLRLLLIGLGGSKQLLHRAQQNTTAKSDGKKGEWARNKQHILKKVTGTAKGQSQERIVCAFVRDRKKKKSKRAMNCWCRQMKSRAGSAKYQLDIDGGSET